MLTEAEIRHIVGMHDAVAAVEQAFAELARGHAQLPAVIHFDFPAFNGDAHVKGAYLDGDPYYVVKIASGFYDNPTRNLSVGAGLVLAFDAQTGHPVALLLDNGFLTDLRTGAAAGVSAKFMANQKRLSVGFVGAGVEARFAARAFVDAHEIGKCRAWSRSEARAESFASEMREELGIDVTPVGSPEAAVRDADLVVTATPSRTPIVQADWLSPGTHVVALGSDGPEKQELDVEVLARADVVVADRLAQCLEAGELHHAVEAGVLSVDRVAELGDVVVGAAVGRRDPADITVCDLTGVGVQDAAVARLALIGAQSGDSGSELAI